MEYIFYGIIADVLYVIQWGYLQMAVLLYFTVFIEQKQEMQLVSRWQWAGADSVHPAVLSSPLIR